MNFIQLQVTDYNITLLLKARYFLLFKSFSILFFFVKLKQKTKKTTTTKNTYPILGTKSLQSLQSHSFDSHVLILLLKSSRIFKGAL